MRIIENVVGMFDIGNIYQYFSSEEIQNTPLREDLKQLCLNSLHKECKYGTIIGIENNEVNTDYYFIIANLNENKITYHQLCEINTEDFFI